MKVARKNEITKLGNNEKRNYEITVFRFSPFRFSDNKQERCPSPLYQIS